MGPIDAWIKAVLEDAFRGRFTPAIEAVLAAVKADLEAHEAKLPSYWVDKDGNRVPEGTPDAIEKKIGASDEFIEKLIRARWNETLTADLIGGLVASVLKVVKDGKGPTRRNRVGLA